MYSPNYNSSQCIASLQDTLTFYQTGYMTNNLSTNYLKQNMPDKKSLGKYISGQNNSEQIISMIKDLRDNRSQGQNISDKLSCQII